jgi:hypothetical protein
MRRGLPGPGRCDVPVGATYAVVLILVGSFLIIFGYLLGTHWRHVEGY